ncbi:unnamed protein product [Arabidopsis arenosa]|uniref:Uncharacterized protein n=1 Tax=Arabidopsis arenosa TaxID=38785 RepID=A0A8S2AZC1_ARAAE|nr:unnamed protein product [Arabidopsis arenosa]
MEGIESGSRQGKRVVVIGGGLAAKLLQFHADVTLIDPKEYFEITWASLRSMVEEPKFAERTVINHKSYLKQGRVVTSPAINITESDVMTEDGSKTRQEKLSHYQAGPVDNVDEVTGGLKHLSLDGQKRIGATYYIECSSKTQQNVKAVFDAAIKVVIKPAMKQKEKKKSRSRAMDVSRKLK